MEMMEEKMEAKITKLLDEEQVASRIKELAEEINRDYAGKEVHLICILHYRTCKVYNSTSYHGLYVCFKLWQRNRE